MDKKYVKVLSDTWTNSTKLLAGRVMEVEEETAERWEDAGIVAFTTEGVFKAQQNMAREERAAARAKNATPEERAEMEREEREAKEAEEPKARMISREQAPK